jgi:hypothetical protein
MSLANYPHDATPEEVAAYKFGKAEATKQIRICAQRVLEYELALNAIRRAPDTRTTFEIATRALAKHGKNA